MSKIRVPLLLAALIAGLGSAPVSAQGKMPVCAARAQYVAFLEKNLNETQEDLHLVSEHTLMELFISPEGNWTVLTTTAGGISCLAGSGEGLAKRVSL
jgi:hypothetical protein